MWIQISTKNGVVIINSSTLSVFGVGKREPSYSNDGRYSITEHHRLRFSERLTPVFTMGFDGALDLFFENFQTSLAVMH